MCAHRDSTTFADVILSSESSHNHRLVNQNLERSAFNGTAVFVADEHREDVRLIVARNNSVEDVAVSTNREVEQSPFVGEAVNISHSVIDIGHQVDGVSANTVAADAVVTSNHNGRVRENRDVHSGGVSDD